MVARSAVSRGSGHGDWKLTSDEQWDRLEVLAREYVLEFAERVAHYGGQHNRNLRWRLENENRVVLSVQEEIQGREEAYGEAFYLQSFAPLEAALAALPDVAVLQANRGPREFPVHVNFRDFSFRTAEASIRFDSNGTVQVDLTQVSHRVSALRALAESETLDTQLVILLRGPYCTRDEIRELRDGVVLRRLTNDELLLVAARGLIIPRPRYDLPNRAPALVVDVRESERVALIHRVSSPNVGADANVPLQDLSAIAQADIGRLGDALAIAQGVRLEVTGWYAAPASPLSGTASWQSSNPLTPDTHFAVTQYPIAESTLQAWNDLLVAESRQNGSAIRLGSRRIGLAVARTANEDRLVDAMIALEALLAVDSDERSKARVTGARAALLWSDPAGELGQRVKAAVEEAYHARNRVVHGDETTPEQIREASRRSLIVGRAIATAQLEYGRTNADFIRDWHAIALQHGERARAAAAGQVT